MKELKRICGNCGSLNVGEIDPLCEQCAMSKEENKTSMTPDKVEQIIKYAKLKGCSGGVVMSEEALREALTQHHQDLMREVVEKERGRIKKWAQAKKDKLTMKWDNDKAKSTVYDAILYDWDDFPTLTEAQDIIKSLKP